VTGEPKIAKTPQSFIADHSSKDLSSDNRLSTEKKDFISQKMCNSQQQLCNQTASSFIFTNKAKTIHISFCYTNSLQYKNEEEKSNKSDGIRKKMYKEKKYENLAEMWNKQTKC